VVLLMVVMTIMMMMMCEQVLTTGYWPGYRPIELSLPPVMQRCMQVFGDYYSQTTTHRKLQWVYNLGSVFVKGVFNKKAYEMQVLQLEHMSVDLT
jgi:cullin 1